MQKVLKETQSPESFIIRVVQADADVGASARPVAVSITVAA